MTDYEKAKVSLYVNAVYNDLLHYEKHSNEFDIEYFNDLIEALGTALTILDKKEK